jgi:hypothetical protein
MGENLVEAYSIVVKEPGNGSLSVAWLEGPQTNHLPSRVWEECRHRNSDS